MPEEEEQPEFTRKYVEELREEAAKYRVANKPFKEAFGNYSPEESEFLLGLVKDLANPISQPKAAIEMRNLAYQLVGEEKFLNDAPWSVDDTGGIGMPEETETEAGGNETPATAGLTREELVSILDERDKAREQQNEELSKEEEVQKIIDHAASLGFKQGTREYAMLMWEATNSETGDLEEAATKVREVFPAAEEGKGEETEETEETNEEEETPRFPKGAKAGGAGAQAAPPVEAPKTFEEARARMEARLEGTGVGS